MVNFPKDSGFVVAGAASGQIFASQVGNIGLVGSFGGMALGTPVIVVSGALAGAAIAGILEGIETGDVKVLGVTTVGSVLGAGCAATVGNVGVGIAGTAFGIGMGTMAITGGLFALGAYQLIKMFAKSGQVESYDQVFSRMETQISENEFYIQALLELDPVLQELTWYGKFANLDADYELQQFKKILELEQNQGDYPWQNISDDEELKKLRLELGQIIEENGDEEKILYNYQAATDEWNKIITLDLPNLTWQATELHHFDNPQIYSLTISDDNSFVFSGHSDGNVRQWDLHSKQHSKTYISGQSELITLEIGGDPQIIFAAGLSRRITAWNVQSQDIFVGFFSLNSHLSHNAKINCLVSSPDGKVLASGSDDGIIKLWDLKTAKWKRNFNAHEGSVNAITFGADGQKIISGHENGSILIWKVNDWKYQLKFGNHDQSIADLVLIEGGKTLISASIDGMVKVWDLIKQSCLRSFKAHESGLLGISINPLTKLIATATNKEVKLWDWKTGKCLQVLNGSHPIKFSADGKLLITYSVSKILKIWQLQRCKQEIELKDFSIDLQWWEVLGVSPNDDAKTVKSAYYKLAKKYHPDQNITITEQLKLITAMQKINQAYEYFCRLKKDFS